MAAHFPEAGEALSFCICEQPFRLAAATAVSYINPPADKKQLGQKREREESVRGRRKESQRKRGSDGRTQRQTHRRGPDTRK